jgi:hypothetical protein
VTAIDVPVEPTVIDCELEFAVAKFPSLAYVEVRV